MSVADSLARPTSDPIGKARRIHKWILQARSQSPVDAFKPSNVSIYQPMPRMMSNLQPPNLPPNHAPTIISEHTAIDDGASISSAESAGAYAQKIRSRSMGRTSRNPLTGGVYHPHAMPMSGAIPGPMPGGPMPQSWQAPQAPIVVQPSRTGRRSGRSRSRTVDGPRIRTEDRGQPMGIPPPGLPRDYIPTGSGPDLHGEHTRGHRHSRRSGAQADLSRSIPMQHAQQPMLPYTHEVPYPQPIPGPPHHYPQQQYPHRHHRDSGHHRPLSQSRGPSATRPGYERRRSHSVDEYDPRKSRTRPTQHQAMYGTGYEGHLHGQPLPYGVNPYYANTGHGDGRMTSSQIQQPQSQIYGPPQKQPQMYTRPQPQGRQGPSQIYTQQRHNDAGGGGAEYSSSSSPESPITPVVSQYPPAEPTVVPIEGGLGGWVVVPSAAQEMRVMEPSAGKHIPTTTVDTRGRQTHTTVDARGRQTTPGFFARLRAFGLGSRSKSVAVPLQPAQYVSADPRYERSRSRARKIRRDSYSR